MKENFLCQVIILFATPLIVMSDEYDKCGLLKTNTGLHAISGSSPEDMHAPWLASVGKYVSVNKVDVYKVFCSASVLTPRILVSAAHCFHLNSWQKKTPSKYLLSHIKAGGTRRDNKNVVERKIQDYKLHPQSTYPVGIHPAACRRQK